MNKIGFYAGSFDPFTNGHLHVVKVSSQLFDKVIIGIGVNPNKKRRFNAQNMMDAIKQVLKHENLLNVDVISYHNLSATTAIENNANFLIRGIRNTSDYDFEEILATYNKDISGLDTIYIRAGQIGPINSTIVVDLIKNNIDVSKYLPIEIINAINLEKEE